MTIKKDAAKREAGKVSAKNKNDRITAEIGKVYLTMEKINGKMSIELSTDCVDPELNALRDFASDEHGVILDPEAMFTEYMGHTVTAINRKVYDAIRKWIANNTHWKFMRDVDDSNLIDSQD